jgi:hypothetical protein
MEREYINITIRLPLGTSLDTCHGNQKQRNGKNSITDPNVTSACYQYPNENVFSPSRWQMVINAMLEKIPGKPFLHKLRVIHILEADYNLTLKNIFGRRLMQNCEQHGTLGELQDGF